MGYSNPLIFNWYQKVFRNSRKALSRTPKGRGGLFGEILLNEHLRTFCELTGVAPVECYDIQLRNWDINQLGSPNAISPMAAAACLRTSLFSKDPRALLFWFHEVLQPGGLLAIDWMLGSSNVDPEGKWSFGFRGMGCRYQEIVVPAVSSLWDESLRPHAAIKTMLRHAVSEGGYAPDTDWSRAIKGEFEDAHLLSMKDLAAFNLVALEVLNTAETLGRNSTYILTLLQKPL